MCLNPLSIKVKGQRILVPCGKCVECDMAKSNEWAYRIMLESKLYDKNTFLTLTYNPENLPPKGALSKRHLQLFFKRLRKSLSLTLKDKIKIRYFACGEYGSKYGRCHYHIIIFNYDFDDKYFWKYSQKGFPLYRSPKLEKIWTLGFSTINDLTFDDMRYCAKYCQKGLKFDDGRQKPFLLMSKGIGRGALSFSWLETDKIYLDGHFIKIPRYFLDKLESLFPGVSQEVRAKRKKTVLLDYTDFATTEKKSANIKLERKRKKFSNFFEKSLDKDFHLCYDKEKKGGDLDG